MKIIFIGGRDIHKLGGIESYMYNLATQLVRMGHEPVVFCESDKAEVEWVNGFRVVHQKSVGGNLVCKPWLGLKATLRTVFHEKHVDVIHYNAWPPSLSSPIARLFCIKSLMQGHGLEWQRSKYSARQQKIMKWMEWFTAHLNRNLIMCSEDQTRYFKEHYGRTAVTIPTAVNMPEAEGSDDEAILRKHGLEKKGYFLFLARLVKDKNPDLLIKAFIRSEHRDKKLVIAGNNDADRPYVEYLHGLSNGRADVVFTGAVYGNEKNALLRNACSFCIPSTIEGLSISLLEAMSYSLPVIASDIPANREVLEADKALWVRPENEEDLRMAIEESVHEPERIAAPVKYNHDYVMENYTWEVVARRYIDCLEVLCHSK